MIDPPAPSAAPSPMPARVAKFFFALWILCHILYPLWFPLSGGVRSALILWSALIALAVGIALWLRPMLLQEDASPPQTEDPLADLVSLPKDALLWGLIVLIVIIRARPLTLPIHIYDGGDEGVHMGFPALPFKFLTQHLFFPYPIAAWIFFCVCFYYRQKIADISRGFFRSLIRPRPLAVAAAAALSGAYCAAAFLVVRYFLHAGHPTFAKDLLRFPPLCNCIHIPFYLFLGVSDLSGRLPEFLFFISTGLLLYKLLLEFRSKPIARLTAAMFWFSPPFAYFSIRGSQTEGEAFFYVLVCWFFVRWALRGQRAALYWGALAVAAGSMYRYTVPLLAMLLAAMTFFPWKGIKRPPFRILIECAVLMTLMIAPWMISYLCYKLRPYTPIENHSALNKLVVPAMMLPHAVSWPIALLMALGLLLALFRNKDMLQKYLLAWFGAYYLFIGLDAGEFVRLNMPMYLPLIIWAAESVFILVKNERWARRLGTCIVVYLFLITTFVPLSPMEPHFTLLQSLKTEYLPLRAAAKELDHLPDGTRLLAIDCSQGCFTMEIARPHAVDWTVSYSRDISSIENLKKICTDKKIEVVMYTAGSLEAEGPDEGNPRLLNEFQQASGWLAPRKEFVLGDNKIIFKNVHRPD